MAYLNSFNSIVVKSELDLFSQKPTQTAIEQGYFIEVRPISVFDSQAPIEFIVNESTDYVDCNFTQLRLKIKICRDDGSALKEGDSVVPVNNLCASLFDHVSLELNGKSVTIPGNSYNYRSYFESLLNFSGEAKSGHLASGLFIPDEPGKFEDISSTGFVKRKSFMHNGVIELSSFLHLDVTNQGKALLNGISMRFKFYRSKSNFSLMTLATDTQAYRIDIQEAVLLIRKLKLNSSILIAHERTLAKNNAKMPINRIEVKKLTLPKDTQSKTLDNIWIGEFHSERERERKVYNFIISTKQIVFHHFRSASKENFSRFCGLGCR